MMMRVLHYDENEERMMKLKFICDGTHAGAGTGLFTEAGERVEGAVAVGYVVLPGDVATMTVVFKGVPAELWSGQLKEIGMLKGVNFIESREIVLEEPIDISDMRTSSEFIRGQYLYIAYQFCPWCEGTRELYVLQVDDDGTRHYVCKTCLLPHTWTKPKGIIKDERLT